MRVSIHQPSFIPYLGFFRKALLSDIFIIYDTAQYPKNDWHNRNRLKFENGVQWITIPVSCHLGDNFLIAKPAGNDFINQHLEKITRAFKKSAYFNELFPAIKDNYQKPYDNLSEFNCNFLLSIFDILEIKTKIRFSHEFNLQNKRSTDALVSMIKLVQCDTYLGGIDTLKYAKADEFQNENINLEINNFIAKPYKQQFGDEFISNLSVLDALFNIGPQETRKLIEDSI